MTRKGKKLRKSSLKPALWSFVHLITKSHMGSVPLSSALRAPGEPQNPSRAHLCQGLDEDTSLSRWETLWVFSTVCWVFFPTQICHNKMTVGTYFSIPHEVWNPKSSKELLWQLPRYLWEPALHLFKPCWSHVPPQQGPDFLQNISTVFSAKLRRKVTRTPWWGTLFTHYFSSYSEFLPLSNSKLTEDAGEPALSRRLDEMVCSSLTYSTVFK